MSLRISNCCEGWLGRAAWLLAGLVLGLAAGGVLPHAPLHAVATDRYENFAMATGPVDEDMECLYFLDSVTGELKATALSPVTGKFQAAFTTNVLADLQVDPSKNPKYLMTTGLAQLRRIPGAGNVQPGAAVVYVAELSTGQCVAYAVPWNSAASRGGATQFSALVPLDKIQFRTAAVREK
jgi:hypothetical protein